MENLHENNVECYNILDNTVTRLLSLFGESICIERNHKLSKEYGKIISLKRIIHGKKIKLIICFPRHFPIYFPDIFIDKKEDTILHFPHINNRGFICTVNKITCFPNYYYGFDMTIKLINKAIEIIRNGIRNKFRDEFKDEFLAYWNDGVRNTYCLYSLINPNNGIKKLVYRFMNSNTQSEGYIFDNYESANSFFRNSGLDNETFIEKEILYIPFRPNFFPYVKRSNDIYKIIKYIYGNDIFDVIDKIYNVDDNHPLFLSSIKYNDEYLLFAWEPNQDKILDGFRKMKTTFSLCALKISSGRNIIKYNVKRIDIKSIVKRTGMLYKEIFDKKIFIIGCGSLGSHLSMHLSKAGFSNFTLIDNEELEHSNIGRHLCGYKYIGKPKSFAVRLMIINHFPMIKCEGYYDDIINIYSNNNSIDENDFSIIAIGKTNIEIAIDKINSGRKLYLWLEPFALCGHAIYIPNKSEIRLKDFYDENYKYKLSVISNPDAFDIRESGCQTSFTPYSCSDMELFISVIIPEIIKILEHNSNSTQSFIWVGNLDNYRDFGIKINEKYKNKKYELIYYSEIILKQILNGNNN